METTAELNKEQFMVEVANVMQRGYTIIEWAPVDHAGRFLLDRDPKLECGLVPVFRKPEEPEIRVPGEG